LDDETLADPFSATRIPTSSWLSLADIVAQSGTGFAFPSQTVYLGRDEGLDTKLGEKAKQEVANWRRTHKFPFPRFALSQLERLTGSIRYPPPGSPDFDLTEEELSEGGEQLSAEPMPEQSDDLSTSSDLPQNPEPNDPKKL